MNTNAQTIHQMGQEISSLVKQATGRESVSSIDMDWVSVEQMARYIYGSGSGDVVSFETNIPDAIESLIANITAVQDTSGGDPSPSNVCPITGWTGCTITNENMLDSSDPDYHADTYSFTFPDEAGTVYGGTLDALSGVLTVDMAVKTFNGSESWSVHGSIASWFYIDNAITDSYALASESNFAISNTYIQKKYADATRMNNGDFAIGRPNSSTTRLIVKDTRFTTASDFKTALSSSNLQLVYKLDTPVTYQLSAQEVTALIGANNVFADTGNVSVQYKVKEDLV